jgi:hypothetical protein
MLSTSEAAAAMGRVRSPKKAEAARENGKKGGGPRKVLADIPCNCGAGDSLEHKSTCPRGRTIRRRRKLGQPLTWT